MTGLILRLAAPIQSWGEHSAFTDRDTQRFPTRSGVIGMFAAAQGLPRGADLGRYSDLRFTVRIDRPGVQITDFHTVGGGRPAKLTVPTAEGGRRSPAAATIVTRRNYLSDAAFTIAVEGPDEHVLADIAEALGHPHWQPYLGRRSCPPEQPLLLRSQVDDPVAHLRECVPVPRWQPKEEGQSLRLDFVHEGGRDDATTVTELADIPETFEPLRTRYRPRAVSIVAELVPAELCKGIGRTYREALYAYMEAQ